MNELFKVHRRRRHLERLTKGISTKNDLKSSGLTWKGWRISTWNIHSIFFSSISTAAIQWASIFCMKKWLHFLTWGFYVSHFVHVPFLWHSMASNAKVAFNIGARQFADDTKLSGDETMKFRTPIYWIRWKFSWEHFLVAETEFSVETRPEKWKKSFQKRQCKHEMHKFSIEFISIHIDLRATT